MKRTFLMAAATLTFGLLMASCGGKTTSNSDSITDYDSLADSTVTDSVPNSDEDSVVQDNEQAEESDQEQEDETSHPAKSSAEASKTLRSYERMVNKLDRMATKLGKGDVGIMDIQELAEEAEKLSGELDGQKAELSEADVETLLKLEAKVAAITAKIAGKTAGALLGF